MSVKVTFLGSGDSFGSGGRFQTCILVDTPTTRFLIDCGASSMIPMRARGIDPNSIDAILITHLHGDHCAGVPFMLIDAMLASKRRRPLIVAGPPGTTALMETLRDALFPGSHVMKPKFPYRLVEMEIGRQNSILDLFVIAVTALHTPETHPTMLRVECAGKIICYTGDTEWTEDLIAVSAEADLLISECYFYDKRIRMHMNYATLKSNLSRLAAKRIVLTHMSDQMLARVAELPEQCAADGLVVEL
jgi:ribonuclease BN (tRNA processing enzyme)